MAGNDAFYFVSTPLNTILATLLALQKPEERSHLLFVDRREGASNPMMEALMRWPGSPFDTLHTLVTKGKKPWQNYTLRKKAFSALDTLVARYRPAPLYTCNDRRIEFLFGIEAARRLGYTPHNSYIDDGVYSYFPTEKKWYQESFPEQWLKQALYGSWYRVPRVVGSSALLDDAYLLFPEQAHRYLRHKPLHRLDLAPLRQAPMQKLFDTYLDVTKTPLPELSAVATLFILPHSSLFKRYAPFVAMVTRKVAETAAPGSVGIKYHPREAIPDLLELTRSAAVTAVPSAVPFEILLPKLGEGTALVGNVSTALLTAKLIRPDIRVTAFVPRDDRRSQMLIPLFKVLGIGVETL